MTRSASDRPSAPTAGRQFVIGSRVEAHDGHCGELTRLVIEPAAGELTHLVVKPRRHPGLGVLVPLELVQSDGDPVRLRCDRAALAELDDAYEVELTPMPREPSMHPGAEVYSWPHYGVGLVAGMGVGAMNEFGTGHHATPQPMVSEEVPTGEVGVHRDDEVQASDGRLGSLEGLIVSSRSHLVTHVLVKTGHLWGRRHMAIPVEVVTRVGNQIRVALTVEQAATLPRR